MKMPENVVKLTNEIKAGKSTAKEALQKLKKNWAWDYYAVVDGKEVSINKIFNRGMYKMFKRLERRREMKDLKGEKRQIKFYIFNFGYVF